MWRNTQKKFPFKKIGLKNAIYPILFSNALMGNELLRDIFILLLVLVSKLMCPAAQALIWGMTLGCQSLSPTRQRVKESEQKDKSWEKM